MITLTSKLIHSAGSYGGHGFNKAQLDLLGISWPPTRGWLLKLTGKSVPDGTWAQVVSLTGKSKWKELKQQKIRAIQSRSSPDLSPATASNTINVYFDGGTTGSNGECEDGYGSWEVEWNGFKKRVERVPFLADGVLHRVTNNVAEWLALKCALMWLESVADKPIYTVRIHGDSKLVLYQLDDRWKCRNANMRELKEGCLHYLNGFHWTTEWQPRNANVERFGH